jgi:hypothetical protein
MPLCEYELNVLRHAAGDKSINLRPGAALWAAAEGLAENGYIQKGKPTEKGLRALSENPVNS